ncbi:SpoIIAA family protein [Rubinisphaera italica]|uniref:Uncharacterized protein n=1 Tax=Rubinisphaera italica TaxID=2527969 RepID=A0A5C5XFQ9_9PLAN|nr:STAS/SEC14 domain-containing protein [Rubinisphaera italica]TWT60985.1 hypothetical protein Pan54_17170 [Rubinisphaera italica]
MSHSVTEINGTNVIEVTTALKIDTALLSEVISSVRTVGQAAGKVRLFFHLPYMTEWDGTTPWAEVLSDETSLEQVERVAVLADSQWEQSVEGIAMPCRNADVKFFSLGTNSPAQRMGFSKLFGGESAEPTQDTRMDGISAARTWIYEGYM